jgi:hypothetical protein
MPAPNAGAIVARPIFEALSNVILSLSKDGHEHDRKTAMPVAAHA